MRLFVVIVAFCLYGVVLWSQEVTSSHYVIEVNQRFNSSNHCDDGYPSLSKATFTIYKDDSTLKKEECEGVRHSDSYFTAKTSFNLDKNSYNTFTSIEFYDETRGIGRKGNTFTDTKKIPKSDLQIGENTITPNCEGSAKCSPRHTEGYTIRTSIIIDNPIDIEIIGEKESYSVEKDELLLQLDDFYENGKGFEIQYKCENADIKNWQRIYNNNKKITSGGLLSLRYEDIVGKFSDSNKAYNDCSGKVIGLRIVKTLLDQTKTCGNTIEVRFCFQGPDFYVENIRRPECNHGNIDIRVIVTPGTSNYKMDDSTFTNYSWVVSKKGDSTSPTIGVSNGVSKVKFEPEGNNRYKLTPEGEIINNDNVESDGGSYLLQLQVLDEYGNPKDLDFAFREFSIPAKLPKIEVTPDTTSLFTYKGVNYHLFSAKDPYVVLQITDDDKTEMGRMPYKVYNSAGELLAEITDTIKVDDKKLRADFEKEYNYNSLTEEWVKEWFSKNKEKAKVEKISGSVSGKKASKVTNRKIIIQDRHSTFPIYYIAIENKNSDSGSGSYLGYKLLTLKYNGTWTKSYTNGNPYTNYIDAYEELFYLDKNTSTKFPNISAEIVGGNERFLLLKSLNNDSYSLYDLSENKEISIPSEAETILSKSGTKVFINSIGDLVLLVDKKIVKEYRYLSISGVITWEESAEQTLQYEPMSVQNILFESDDIVKYTTSDGSSYREYNNITEDTFIGFWRKGNAANLPKDAFKERYERLWKQYYLQHYGYHIHGIETNKDEELTLIDNDGCPYTILYRVNVLEGPQVEFEKGYPHNPQGINTANGEAKLRVYPGGDITYYYKGDKIGDDYKIVLTGLPWGKNTVPFTDKDGNLIYEYPINLEPKIKFETTPQTCSSANGQIIPQNKETKSNDVGSATWWQFKSLSDGSNNKWVDGLDKLKAGSYKVRGLFGNDTIPFDTTLIVRNEIFDVSVKSTTDATTIGGTGSVELNIQNQTKDITWTDTDTQATYTDYKQAIFTARKYNWTATPSLDECEVHVSFEIKAPKVELVNASVIYNADTKEAHVHVEGKKNDLVSSYQFTINDLAFYNDTVIENVDAETELYLGLSYKTTDDNNKNKEICIVRPTTTFAPSAMPDEDNATRCPSELGVINVTNCDYINCEYSIDNGNFQQLSNIKNIEAVDGRHSITFRLHSTEQTDLGNIALYTTHEIDSIDIEPAQLPIITTSYTDVTCLGANDGEIFIIDTQNIRGNAQLSLDGETWTNSAISKLSQGLYTIYQRDNFCPADTIKMQYNIASPNTPLQIATTAISHPSCNAIDGEISVEVSGGWSEMYKVLSDTLITNEILEDEAGYSDEVQYTFGNLCGGTHTIYVADANGCYVSVDTKLNDHALGVAYELSITDASCFDFVDGSLSLMNIQGFSSANCTLTKAGNIIWQEDIDVFFDTVAIHSALRAGNDYSVILRNDAGCIGSDRFYVNQPPKIELDLGPDITICPNNTVTLDAGNYNEFCWQRDGNELSSQQQITVDKSGKYGVEITDSYGCHASDEVNIEVGNSALQANFLMASDVALNDTVVLIELSNMQPDNIEWLYPDTAFDDVTPADAEYYLLYLCPKVKGTFKIEMKAYANGCESIDTKQIMVLNEVEDTSDFKIGYDPLIKQAKVNPNPNNGEFELVVKLREVADIDVTIADVDSGQKVEHIVLKGSDSYNSRLNIKQWGSGIFVLSIVSGTERRAIKVLCVR